MIRVWIRLHPFAKRSKRVCIIITQRPLGQSPTKGNSVLLECRSAIQKCRIGSWRSNALSCSGAIWSLLLGFFGRSLYLDVFSTSILWFFVSFLDNSGFFKSNYLEDKYLKINLHKVQIIHNFIVIQLSLYSYEIGRASCRERVLMSV